MSQRVNYPSTLKSDEWVLRSWYKNKLIQFIVDDGLYAKLSSKLMKDDVSVSTYMRNLIIKDMDV